MGIFSKKQQKYVSEGPYNWENLLNSLLRSTGNFYFENYPSVSVKEILEKSGSQTQMLEMFNLFLPDFENWKIRENFLPLTNDIYRSPDHKDGWKTLSSNKSRMCSKFENVTKTLGLKLTQTDLSDGSVMFYGIWQTEQNNSFIQYGSFYEDTKGNEYLYWKVDVLYNSAEVKQEDFRMEQVIVHQPSFFQAAFYLAETKFPSTSNLLNLGRQLTYSEHFPVNLLPRPVLRFQTPGGYLKPKKNQLDWKTASFVTSIGYEISNELSQIDLTNALVVVMDSFPKILSIMEDGYVNYNFDQYEDEDGLIPFEMVMGSKTNTWVPITL